MDFKSKIILIYGPTASGKSSFAIKLAKKIDGEVINADSMQVYKELKILSARPNKEDYKNIKHHLYGFQNVKKKFSTGGSSQLCESSRKSSSCPREESANYLTWHPENQCVPSDRLAQPKKKRRLHGPKAMPGREFLV